MAEQYYGAYQHGMREQAQGAMARQRLQSQQALSQLSSRAAQDTKDQAAGKFNSMFDRTGQGVVNARSQQYAEQTSQWNKKLKAAEERAKRAEGHYNAYQSGGGAFTSLPPAWQTTNPLTKLTHQSSLSPFDAGYAQFGGLSSYFKR